MSINRDLKKLIFRFIKSHEEEINSNKFEDLYIELNKKYESLKTVSTFTQILLDVEINPIPYLTDIPRSFAAYLTLDKVVLPEGVYTIGNHSFYNSHINELYLPHSLIEILDDAFFTSRINKIIYNGTKDEFYAIRGRDAGYLDAARIECKDGVIVDENY